MLSENKVALEDALQRLDRATASEQRTLNELRDTRSYDMRRKIHLERSKISNPILVSANATQTFTRCAERQ